MHALNGCLSTVRVPGNNSSRASLPMSTLGIIWARLIPELTPAFYTTSCLWGGHRPHAKRSHRFQQFLHELIARQGRRDRCTAIRTPLL